MLCNNMIVLSPTLAVYLSYSHGIDLDYPCTSATPLRMPITCLPNMGISSYDSLLDKVIFSFEVYGSDSVPIYK